MNTFNGDFKKMVRHNVDKGIVARREILRVLAERGPQPIADICARVGRGAADVSVHLKRLAAGGHVVVSRTTRTGSRGNTPLIYSLPATLAVAA